MAEFPVLSEYMSPKNNISHSGGFSRPSYIFVKERPKPFLNSKTAQKILFDTLQFATFILEK